MGSDKPDYTLGISILEQALANLTAVVSATSLDIRALDSSDIAHESLPYDIDWLADMSETIEVDDEISNDWDQTDDAWAAGEHFYISQIVFWITSNSVALTSEMIVRYYQGIEFSLYDRSDVNKSVMKECFNDGWIHRGSGVGPWSFQKTYYLDRMIRIDSGNTIRAVVGNWAALDLISFHMRIGGVSK